MALNIKQIAEIAGVATSTISRATNPNTRHLLSEETLKKIDAIVKKHGYVPNIAARHLNKPGTKTIGVILPYYERMFYHSYYIHVLAGIADALIDTDYSFKLVLLKPTQKKWNWYDFQVGEGVEGVIVTHWQSFFSSRFLTKPTGIPHVVINDFDEHIKTYFVCEDSEMGGQLAAEHFIDNGHRTVAAVTGKKNSRDSIWRTKGFIDCFESKSIPISPNYIFEGDFGGGPKVEVAVDEILKLKPRPTAIFAANDKMAIIIMSLLEQKGYSCPDDFSIIGYDNIDECQTTTPPLTTIHQPLYDIAKQAVSALIEHLSEKKPEAPFRGNQTLPVTLVQRASVKKI